MAQQQADWIGFGEATYDGEFHPTGEWGHRKIGYAFDNVEVYASRVKAEAGLALAPSFGIVDHELVHRVNGIWCNVW